MVKPRKIRLEAASVCQLRCPSCPTTTRAIHPAVGSGLLRLSDFRKLIEQNPWIREIELSNYGEIFLNPELSDIIRLAYRHNVKLTASNGVNLNNVDPGTIEDLVRYQFSRITCSIDGASEDTYGRYRVKGKFGRVIENIKAINHFKKAYESAFPLLIWQYVIFGHNEHEIPQARALAKQLNMVFQLKLSWDPELSPIRAPAAVRRQVRLPVVTRKEFKEHYGKDYMQDICHQLWEQPQINWNGKVLGCCRNFWGDFGGNAFQDGLLHSLNHEKMHYARNMLLGAALPRTDIPCSTCEIYLDMQKSGNWLRRGIHRFLNRILVFIHKICAVLLISLPWQRRQG